MHGVGITKELTKKPSLLLSSLLSLSGTNILTCTLFPAFLLHWTSLQSRPLPNQRCSIKSRTVRFFFLCVDPSAQLLPHPNPPAPLPAPLVTFKKRQRKLPLPFSSVCVLILLADCLVVFVRV